MNHKFVIQKVALLLMVMLLLFQFVDTSFAEITSIEISADNSDVIVNEGETASNSGSIVIEVTPSYNFIKHNIDNNVNFPQTIYSVDLDDDGDMDVLSASYFSNYVAWWENDGTPVNGGWIKHTIENNFYRAYHVFGSDLDDDGDMDVIGSASYGATVAWWENDGTPGDGGWIKHIVTNSFSGANTIYVSDLDEDSDEDLLVSGNTADSILWWENDGTPGDGGWLQFTISNNVDGAISVNAADLDGDSDEDVLGVGGNTYNVYWWENDGSENFTEHIIDNNYVGYDVYPADIDSDNDLDIFSVSRSGDEITWWENDGSENFLKHTIEENINAAWDIYPIDIEGDGDIDALSSAAVGEISLWLNDGSGNFVKHLIVGNFYGTNSVYAKDIDGDGDLDVLGSARELDTIAWWENQTETVIPDYTEVVLTSSIGQVTNNGDGTWSWNYLTSDGPSDSQTVTITAEFSNVWTAQTTFNLTVNNVAPTIENVTASIDPVKVNTEMIAFADFTDPGIHDTHTALWEWGNDSTTSGVVDETNGSGTATGYYTYTSPGVYTIKVTVTDDDGDSDEEIYQFVVVYDPDGGFVTGGGWIESPAGAYTANPLLTGQANFGFVSKYKKGADVPTGQTEFQFHVAGLNFHSDTYDWLVVAGPKAMYKGDGTINGMGNYGFMLSAIDEKLTPSTDVDLFRIKIWDKDNGDALVYDNQVACAEVGEDADPCTEIEGGSIVIHKQK